jgi:hypothetical protein
VTASRLSVAQVRPVPPGSARVLLRTTPLYDALVDEYRLALRTLPGDRTGEDGYQPRSISIPAPYNPNASRHRGANGDSSAHAVQQVQFRY